jgi:hypothetical protein
LSKIKAGIFNLVEKNFIEGFTDVMIGEKINAYEDELDN